MGTIKDIFEVLKNVTGHGALTVTANHEIKLAVSDADAKGIRILEYAMSLLDDDAEFADMHIVLLNVHWWVTFVERWIIDTKGENDGEDE